MTRQKSFQVCMAMMRSRDGEIFEEGFGEISRRAGEHFEALMHEYRQASNHDLRSCLLELLGEARDMRVFGLFREGLWSEDESVRFWSLRGLEMLDAPEARRQVHLERALQAGTMSAYEAIEVFCERAAQAGFGLETPARHVYQCLGPCGGVGRLRWEVNELVVEVQSTAWVEIYAARCPGACLPAARPYHLHAFSASLSHLFLHPGAPLC